MARSWRWMATPATTRCSVAEDPPSSSLWNFARRYELRAETEHQLWAGLDHPFDRPRVGPPRS